MKLKILFLLILLLSSCKNYKFDGVSKYTYNIENEEYDKTEHEIEGKIIIRKNLKLLKIVTSDTTEKYKIDSWKYNYRKFTLFKTRKDRIGIKLKLENGQYFYLQFKSWEHAYITKPNICKDDKIYYNL